jgi:hypothetical protein
MIGAVTAGCAMAHAMARLAGWWPVSSAVMVNFSAVT